MPMTIPQLIVQSHSLAKDKGFWKYKRNPKEDVLIILSNIGEIIKAKRKNRFADWPDFGNHLIKTNDFNYSFETSIKDTFEDEICNVILRITDFFGGHNVDLIKNNEWVKEAMDLPLMMFFERGQPINKYNPEDVSEWLLEAISETTYSERDNDYGLLNILLYLGTIILEQNIDIERHLEEKIKYNSERPMFYSK